MKKAFSLLLALVMCLSLCACGGGEQNGETQAPEKTPETTILGKWVDISDEVNSLQFNEDKTAVMSTHGGDSPAKWNYDTEQSCYYLIISDWAGNTMEKPFALETVDGIEQFVFDSRTFVRKQSSGDKNTQNTADTQNDNSDNPVIYDHTLLHPFISSLYGDWIIDGHLSWYVMPTKITFNEDGTCYAEFPENATNQTMNLYWGIVPDSVDDWGNLYVRIGIDNDIIYIFHVIHQEANIAYHATEGEDGIAIDGLSEDCYTGMWFAMKKP